jgi:hypothetical protein
MEQLSTTDEQELRRLAEQLDCFTEDQHGLLSGWSEETRRAKRKRGEGPPYIRHGRHYFYPRGPYAEYLKNRVRSRVETPAKSLL